MTPGHRGEHRRKGTAAAIDAFDQARSEFESEPSKDAIAVMSDGSSGMLYRLKPRSHRPVQPAIKNELGPDCAIVPHGCTPGVA